MNHNLNILFTSAGRRSYLVKYFKEALGECGTVHVANSSDISPAFLVADHFVVTPLIYDENYIPFLMDYCKENKINAIISLFDIDLPILAQNKEKFLEAGVRVIVSDKWVIDICNDKWLTYQFLKKKGFYVPDTFVSMPEVKKALEENRINFPLMVKPRWGMGSIAIFEAENMKELRVFYEKTQKNILNTYLKYESAGKMEESVLIQKKISGQEYGIDVINDLEGNYQNTIVKMKYAMRSGETDCAVTVDSQILKNAGEKLSGCLHHIGNLDVDVFLVDEKPYILEMNARFGGGYPFSHMAGVDLPKVIVNWLQHEKVSDCDLNAQIGVMAQKDITMVVLKRG